MNFKQIFAVWSLYSASLCTIMATTDTITVKQPERIIITETDSTLKVRVEGREGNKDYLLEREHTDNGNIIVRESNWSTSNLPFIRQRIQGRYAGDGHMPLFMLGFVNALNSPVFMDVNMEASVEMGFYPIYVNGPRLGRHVRLFTGLGFDWRNWRMTGNMRFLRQDNKVSLAAYPADADIKFSRIKVFSISIPLLAELQLKFSSGYTFWWNAGAMLDINTYGSLKTRYTLPSEGKQKDFSKHIYHVPLTADIFTSAGINNIGLYMRYSPCHVLEEASAPSFTSLSVGVMIDF